MTTPISNSDNAPNDKEKLLDSISIQLRSQRQSDIWTSLEKVRTWLQESPEDHSFYGILLDAVADNPDLRERVHSLLIEMSRNGSNSARSALQNLPSSIDELLADADDAYFSAEYDEAIQLYRQILKLDQENVRAKDHLSKSEIRREAKGVNTDIPRVALQYFLRARSHIAARDFSTAINLLSAAVEVAQENGLRYPDAEEALIDVRNLLKSEELKKKGLSAFNKEKWGESLDYYNQALVLDPTNEVTKKELEILRAESKLNKQGVLKIIAPLAELRKATKAARDVIDSGNPLLSFVEKQLNQLSLLRIVGISMLLIGIIFLLFLGIGLRNNPAIPALSKTQTPIFVIIVPTNSPTITTTPVFTNTAIVTPTLVPVTITPTLTIAVNVLGIGYINLDLVTAWENPSAGIVARLTRNQVVTILEKQEFGEQTWFRCSWEVDGIPGEGWILARYIELGPVPTP